jgi:hypothetical protein
VDGIVGWGKFRTGTITGGNVLGLVPKVGVKFSELTSKKASFFNKAWHAVRLESHIIEAIARL